MSFTSSIYQANKISSIFSTITDDANKTSIKVTKIFSNLKNNIDLLFDKANYKPATNSDFTYNDNLYSSLENDVDALTQYKDAVNSGISPSQAFNTYMREASINAQEYANSVNASAISLKNYQTHLNQIDIATQAQNKSLSNCKVLISEYSTGLNKCKLTQEEYIDAIQKTNPQLSNYLSNLNGADATIGGYVGYLIKAKVATIGLQVATTVLNTAISMGISILVSGAIRGISYLIHYEENLIEKSEEAADKISELSESFNNNSKQVSDIAKRFAELAQGVDSLTGKNKSLNNDEYSEFLDLSNQLAEIFPTLSRHYDENGNAIVNLSGDVDTIVKNLNNLLDVERRITNQEIVENLPDLYKGIVAKSRNYNDAIEDYKSRREELENAYNTLTSNDFEANFNKILQGNILNISGVGANLEELDNIAQEYLSVLDKIGLSYEYLSPEYGSNGEIIGFNYYITDFATMSDEEIESAKEQIKSGIHDLAKNYIEQINDLDDQILTTTEKNKANWSGLTSAVASWLSTEDSYSVLDDTAQTVVQNIINGLDYTKLDFSSWDDAKKYIQDNIIALFSGSNSKEIESQVIGLQDAFSKFENSDISYNELVEYINEFKQAINGISGLTSEQKQSLGMFFGINFDDDSTNYDTLINNVKGKVQDEFDDKVETLTLEDLQIASEYLQITDDTLYSWEELVKGIKNAKKELKSAEEASKTFIDRMSEVENLSTGFDQLDKIYKDILNGGDFDYSSILNNDDFKNTFSGLGSVYEEFIKTISNSPNDINACQNAFNNLVTAYINNSDALKYLTDDTRNATIAMLEQMGVSDAAEIVDYQLALQKERLALQTEENTNKTYEEIVALYNSAVAGSVTQRALAELALSKLNVNENEIITSGDIEQIIALANSANASAASLQNLAKAKSLMAQSESYAEKAEEYKNKKGYEGMYFAYRQWAQNYRDKAQEELNKPLEYDEIDISKFAVNYTGGSSSSGAGSSGGSGGSGSSSASTKVVDWIETAIDRIERRIDKLKNTISNTYKTLKNRFSASKDEISAITDEIDLQKKAYDRYMSQANSVGLSSELAQKVRDGSIDISEYDSDTAELISDYQEWYEKALDCADAIDELHESLASLYEEKFDAISTDFDNQLSLIEHKANTYSNKLSILEDNGYRSSYNLYQSLASVEQENIKNLTQKYNSLQRTLQEAVNSGEIEEYSESWYEMKIEINEVNEAIQESTASVLEYKKALRDLKWEQFDDIQEGISNISTEAEFLINLLSNSDLYDDNGQLTNEGLASMGLHGVSYNTYMAQADKYAAEILKINEELADDPANAELIERKQELLELQQDSISAAEDEKQAIIDMVEEGIELELSALQDLIDAYTDALDSAKDLYDYQKKIAGYTDEISSIEKQLSAYENDTSEETKATVQKLKVDLEEARENLQDAEYERYISDQKKLLDDLYNEYDTILNERLDNVDSLITDMIAQINTNSGTICETIGEVANDVGYTISSAMSEIWSKPNDSDIVPPETSYGNGDINKDGVITAADARLALQMAGGLIDKDYSADVNGDGEITASDARMILRAAAKLDKLPIDDNEEAITQVISMYGDNFSSLLTTTNLALSLIESDINDLYNYLTGDVNNDKKITADDARFVLRGSAGLESMTGMQQVLSDVNSDGIITAADARIILRRAAGLEGFASGGVVSDLKSIIKANGDDYLTINTLKKGEAVLTPEQTTDFSKLIDSLPQLNGIVDMSGKLSELRSIHNSGNSEITFGDTIIEIDHVQDYNDFITQLQKDKQFEKMVRSMSVDLLNGGSLLAKNKYKWN